MYILYEFHFHIVNYFHNFLVLLIDPPRTVVAMYLWPLQPRQCSTLLKPRRLPSHSASQYNVKCHYTVARKLHPFPSNNVQTKWWSSLQGYISKIAAKLSSNSPHHAFLFPILILERWDFIYLPEVFSSWFRLSCIWIITVPRSVLLCYKIKPVI